MQPELTVRQVMAGTVNPAANVLWNAITTVETPDGGYADKGPETDEEWATLRTNAENMAHWARMLMLAGRGIAPEGAASTAPGFNLEPDSIAVLVAAHRDEWDAFASELEASAGGFLGIVEARNGDPQAFLDVGDGLTTACDGCHQEFWYPQG